MHFNVMHTQMTAMYKKPVHRFVSASLRLIALALYRGNWQSVAQAVMKCDEISCRVVDLVLKQLQDECEKMCSRSTKSTLHKSSPDDLQSIDWNSIVSELKKRSATPVCSSYGSWCTTSLSKCPQGNH